MTPSTLHSPTRTTPTPAPAGSPAEAADPRRIALTLAERPDLWRPLVRFAEPRFYQRLAAGSRWEAWLLSWLPGQGTGLHDHGGSAGVFTVLDGEVDESVPVRRPGEAARLVTRTYRAGAVRAFGPRHLHDVTGRPGLGSVTLHVYAPRLTAMTRYSLLDGELITVAREREGEDW
jgi:hypothetical protein